MWQAPLGVRSAKRRHQSVSRVDDSESVIASSRERLFDLSYDLHVSNSIKLKKLKVDKFLEQNYGVSVPPAICDHTVLGLLAFRNK